MVGGYFGSKYHWLIDEEDGGGRREEYLDSIDDENELEINVMRLCLSVCHSGGRN